MHHIASCMAILDIVDNEFRKRCGKKVIRIRLSVGSLSATNPEHLKDTLVFCSTGTIAEGAEIELIKRSARLMCPACNYYFEVDTLPVPTCRRCGSSRTEIVDRDGIILESLEIETD